MKFWSNSAEDLAAAGEDHIIGRGNRVTVNEDVSYRSPLGRLTKIAVLGLLLLVPVAVAAFVSTSETSVTNLEIVSVASGGAPSNGGSFFVTTSNDGRYLTFMSLAKNLAPEPPSAEENFSDVFFRDRLTDETIKVSKSMNGGLANEASLDPTITTDGRFIAYFSYASNLIPDDNNGADWSRQGLDVFVWDRHSQQNVRVSLNETGGEIKGNSVGIISADGKYILFVTDGRVFASDWDHAHPSALYLREWHSGQIERISVALDGGFPNAEPEHPSISLDNRFVVFDSDASNLVADDNNGQKDVFVYDRLSQTTRLISRDAAGRPANGRSTQSEIALDGKTVTFVSDATNLVPGDTNGKADIFVYEMDTDRISLVSRAEDGAQGNGDSREPSLCGDGRFVSYTTDANNLFPNDANNQRDIILFDRVKGTNSVATKNWEGVYGNGKAHRSFLMPDCRSIAYASDASNLVPGDDNGTRDIFVGDIWLPADLSRSSIYAPGSVKPGDVIIYSFDVRNDGFISSTAGIVSQVPANTSYVPGSASDGAIYDAGDNQIEWQGLVDALSHRQITYSVVVEPSLVDPTVLRSESLLTGDGSEHLLATRTIVNGFQTHMPLVREN